MGPSTLTTVTINAITQLVRRNNIHGKITKTKYENCNEKGPPRWMMPSPLGATSNTMKQPSQHQEGKVRAGNFSLENISLLIVIAFSSDAVYQIQCTQYMDG